MPAGRKLKWNNCMDLDAACELYFEDCLFEDDYQLRETPIPHTITGLALALGTTRETLMDYQARDEFSDTVKKHKLRVENYAERKLFTGQPTGAIFALKNFGWRDKQEQEISGPGGGPIEIKPTKFILVESNGSQNTTKI